MMMFFMFALTKTIWSLRSLIYRCCGRSETKYFKRFTWNPVWQLQSSILIISCCCSCCRCCCCCFWRCCCRCYYCCCRCCCCCFLEKLQWQSSPMENCLLCILLTITDHLSVTFLWRIPLDSINSRCHVFGQTLISVWQSHYRELESQRLCPGPLDLTSPPDIHKKIISCKSLQPSTNKRANYYDNMYKNSTFTSSLLFILCETSSWDAISLGGGLCLVSKDNSSSFSDWACARDLATDIRTLKRNNDSIPTNT